MLTPQVITLSRLKMPALLEVLRADTTLSLRLYEEVVAGDDAVRKGRVSGRRALDGVAAATVIGTPTSKSYAAPFSSQTAAVIAGDGLSHPGKDFMVLDEMLFDMAGTGGLGKEWSDHATWAFPLRDDGTLDTPFNRTLATWLSKTPEPRYRARENRPYPLRLLVPFKTCSLAQSSLIINANPNYGFIGNVQSTGTLPDATAIVARETVFPSLILTPPATIAPDGTATVTVAVVDANGATIADAACDVLLDPVAGTLPKARATITAGTGSFKVMALGLGVGEAVRVKAGIGFFTGLADITIPVA